MQPHELIAALVRNTGKPLLQVATEMDRASFQSTLHKLVNGQIVAPTRPTAKKVADYFELPVEALYDARLATQIAVERGIDITAPTEKAATRFFRALDEAHRSGEPPDLVGEISPPPYAPGLPPSPGSVAVRRLPSRMAVEINRLPAPQLRCLLTVIDGFLLAVSTNYEPHSQLRLD